MEATIFDPQSAGFWAFEDILCYCTYGGTGCTAKQFTDPNPNYPTKTYKESM
jgi:hypothetical protein